MSTSMSKDRSVRSMSVLGRLFRSVELSSRSILPIRLSKGTLTSPYLLTDRSSLPSLMFPFLLDFQTNHSSQSQVGSVSSRSPAQASSVPSALLVSMLIFQMSSSAPIRCALRSIRDSMPLLVSSLSVTESRPSLLLPDHSSASQFSAQSSLSMALAQTPS